MSKKFILTLDSGTTSCRSLLINKKGEIVASSQKEFEQHFPCSGWVEHDALEIFDVQKRTMIDTKNSLNIKSNDIAALGITNQRETIVVWDKTSGLPVYNAIVWQDLRTNDYCQQLIDEGYSETFQNKTGLIINPYFSGTKLRWILKNVPEVKQKLKDKKILAGTIDTWLMWKLTNGEVHATDVSNASRTLLFNIHKQEWDKELLDILEIPIEILPEVKPSSYNYGNVNPKIFSDKATGIVPITGVAGDQQSALFGQLCTNVGDVKNTYGTGCFTLMNTGTEVVKSKNKLLSTIAWKIGKEKTVYALEGSVFIGGASIQWLRDGLKIIYNANQSDLYAEMVNDDQNVYVVPSFTGLGAPYWDSNAKGSMFGLERGTKREHIIKATLESIAYQTNDLIMSMSKDIKKPMKLLKVDGGASQSNYLMQFQSSISNTKLVRPKSVETTALGASYFAGLEIGFWNIEELKKINLPDKTFMPKISQEKRDKLLNGWNQSIKRTLNWEKDIK